MGKTYRNYNRDEIKMPVYSKPYIKLKKVKVTNRSKPMSKKEFMDVVKDELTKMTDLEIIKEYVRLYAIYMANIEDKESEGDIRLVGQEVKRRNIVDSIGHTRKLIS